MNVSINPTVEVRYKIGRYLLTFVLRKSLSIGYVSSSFYLNPVWIKNPSLKLYKQLSRALGMS
ncbi:hypothetical protein JW926_02220 [Candidatus Sumerlaeota bacterium]|nr:hypothetical protein [Candidatus Sumerlaeota bacterium]